MQFRIGTLISTLAVAALFYSAGVTLIFQKIESMIGTTIGVPRTPPALSPRELAIRIAIGTLAGSWLAFVVVRAILRRKRRRRLDCCAGCGRRLLAGAMRCERCGTRRVTHGTDEPLFPVLHVSRR